MLWPSALALDLGALSSAQATGVSAASDANGSVGS